MDFSSFERIEAGEGDGFAIFARERGNQTGEVKAKVVSGILILDAEVSQQLCQISSNLSGICCVHFGTSREGKLHYGNMLQNFNAKSYTVALHCRIKMDGFCRWFSFQEQKLAIHWLGVIRQSGGGLRRRGTAIENRPPLVNDNRKCTLELCENFLSCCSFLFYACRVVQTVPKFHRMLTARFSKPFLHSKKQRNPFPFPAKETTITKTVCLRKRISCEPIHCSAALFFCVSLMHHSIPCRKI